MLIPFVDDRVDNPFHGSDLGGIAMKHHAKTELHGACKGYLLWYLKKLRHADKPYTKQALQHNLTNRQGNNSNHPPTNG
jgi:hypothetical protein